VWGKLTRLEDPLLRSGLTLMFLALACAVVVFAYAFGDRPPKRADAAERVATKSATKSAAKPLVRSDPGIDPWVERDIPPPKPKVVVGSEVTPNPTPPSEATPNPTLPQAASAPKPAKQPRPLPARRKGTTITQRPEQDNYDLPPGAIMAITIPSLGIQNAPVRDSDAKSALDKGVVHLPDTSLPWSDTPERNVYLAGHRLGWPGTGSYHIFYNLDELTGGERITLRGGNGKRYDYRVLESLIVGPKANWVTGRVSGQDLLTLQTCTPIPTFQYRLIVRAERI
jgi:sortase A